MNFRNNSKYHGELLSVGQMGFYDSSLKFSAFYTRRCYFKLKILPVFFPYSKFGGEVVKSSPKNKIFPIKITKSSTPRKILFAPVSNNWFKYIGYIKQTKSLNCLNVCLENCCIKLLKIFYAVFGFVK